MGCNDVWTFTSLVTLPKFENKDVPTFKTDIVFIIVYVAFLPQSQRVTNTL